MGKKAFGSLGGKIARHFGRLFAFTFCKACFASISSLTASPLELVQEWTPQPDSKIAPLLSMVHRPTRWPQLDPESLARDQAIGILRGHPWRLSLRRRLERDLLPLSTTFALALSSTSPSRVTPLGTQSTTQVHRRSWSGPRECCRSAWAATATWSGVNPSSMNIGTSTDCVRALHSSRDALESLCSRNRIGHREVEHPTCCNQLPGQHARGDLQAFSRSAALGYVAGHDKELLLTATSRQSFRSHMFCGIDAIANAGAMP